MFSSKKINSKNTSERDEIIQLAEFEIRIIRSKRKSISLQVKHGKIVLRAPIFSPNIALKAFALSKINWLRKTSSRIQSTQPTIVLNYIDGDQMLFKGETIILQVAKGSSSCVQFNNHTKALSIIVSNRVQNSKPFIKKKIAEWYK